MSVTPRKRILRFSGFATTLLTAYPVPRADLKSTKFGRFVLTSSAIEFQGNLQAFDWGRFIMQGSVFARIDMPSVWLKKDKSKIWTPVDIDSCSKVTTQFHVPSQSAIEWTIECVAMQEEGFDGANGVHAVQPRGLSGYRAHGGRKLHEHFHHLAERQPHNSYEVEGTD